MTGKRILVVDDEPKMRELISLYLKKENFQVVTAGDGLQALEELEKGDNFSLFIIDVMMPNMDGFTLCKEIRRISQKPVIFLTARGEEYERLMGFEIGADDYIVKPFSPREMVARVKAVLKRTETALETAGKQTYGDLTIDVEGREVKIEHDTLSLTPKEFDLLVYLVKNPGKVLSREQIMNHVWDYEYYGDQRTVDTHIKKLREKLGEKTEKYIKTVWGVGYKFELE
ncbi:response regulator transcription factor [Dehalobacterium formicoaceticum]|uniref:Stage 0 sporulation protein A homolog n=1 Tax=Dehalobacterium formicoaceticum TaxID=51515 RepID=A0ABT1Y4H7_9FIRM|nr:response regulator transcription factor [Dehalobacterium formicoaceticum]MCR6545774.1 response regulator transcription factor [Dehalobacterium formicoaceticum]